MANEMCPLWRRVDSLGEPGRRIEGAMRWPPRALRSVYLSRGLTDVMKYAHFSAHGTDLVGLAGIVRDGNILAPTVHREGRKLLTAVFSYRQVEHCLHGSYGRFEYVGAGIWLRICSLIDIGGYDGSLYPKDTGTRKQKRTKAREVRSDYGYLHGVVLGLFHSPELAACDHQELSRARLRDCTRVLAPRIVRRGLLLGEDEVLYHF